jgi:hypothetical protein
MVIDTDSNTAVIHLCTYTVTSALSDSSTVIAGNTHTSQTVHPFQFCPPHWSQCFDLHPPPPPDVLVGLCVDEVRLGDAVDIFVVDG